MNNTICKYWMLVASKNHVLRGMKEGIAQACHGKAHPLKRMKMGDGVIYYSPKLEFEKDMPCQEFTAIGIVSGEEVYPYDMGNGFVPYRRDIRYLNAKTVPIKSLLDELQFVTDKKRWGYKFRFGAFEIAEPDFQLIAKAMGVVNKFFHQSGAATAKITSSCYEEGEESSLMRDEDGRVFFDSPLAGVHYHCWAARKC